MSISGEKITASVGGAYPRTSPASSELVSGHRTPVTTPSPLAGGAAGPPGRPPKPGSPEDRRGGRGDETLPTATVAGAGRGRHELPRLRTGTWGGGARGNVPPRRLRRTGLQRPTPAGRPPGLRRRESGGGKVESGRPGPGACPRPGPSTSPSTCLPAGPGPGPHRPNGTRHRPTRARTRAGDYLPGHTRGRCTVTSPDRDLGEHSRGGASGDRPAGGTAGPWPGHPARPRVGGHPPERDAGERKQSAIDTEGPTPGRPGPRAGRAGRRTGASRPLNVRVRFPEGGGAPASAGRHDRAAWGTGGVHSLRNLHLQSPANGRRAVATAPPGRFRR